MGAKKQLELTGHAFRNIAAVEEYIAKDSPAAAQKVGKTICSTAEKLEIFPEMGRPGRVPGTRELPLSEYPYTIVYRIRASRIIISPSCTNRGNTYHDTQPLCCSLTSGLKI